MLYRSLGKTGLQVSQLGFGAMRLPMTGADDAARVDRTLAIPMIHRAFEAGVNYIDTAVMYCNNDSEAAVGEALAGWRERIVVSTKNPYFGEDEKTWWSHLENSLRRLRVDAIDLYHNHGINWKSYTEAVEPRIGGWMRKAKEQGLIRHICVSFHDDNAALRRVVETGYADVITLQYNLLDRRLQDGLALAHERGIGVVVMGPVGGGRLGIRVEAFDNLLPNIRRVPELALRFVLANPGVSLALSGMSTIEQVEENIRVASDPVTLRPDDQAAIDAHLTRLQKMADLYCSGCRYCLPCPSGVEIPEVFEQYNLGRVYGIWEAARRNYAWRVKSGKSAAACTQCGACEEKCPQQLSIRAQLREAHAALAERV